MSKSCLVVDDSKVIRKVARHILESMEFSVDEAADGQEALTFCRANRPDVILLDWNMPVMSGMEFLTAFNDLDFGFEDRPRVCSAPPKTASIIYAPRSRLGPTNM